MRLAITTTAACRPGTDAFTAGPQTVSELTLLRTYLYICLHKYTLEIYFIQETIVFLTILVLYLFISCKNISFITSFGVFYHQKIPYFFNSLLSFFTSKS